MKRIGLGLLLTLALALSAEAAPLTFTNARFFKGALSTTTSTVLYTFVTDGLVNSLSCTSGAAAGTTRAVTIAFAGTAIANATALGSHEIISIQVNHFVASGETITGGQDVGTDVTCYISGVKIT